MTYADAMMAIEISVEEERRRAALAARYPTRYDAETDTFTLTTGQVARAMGARASQSAVVERMLAGSQTIDGSRAGIPAGMYRVSGPEADGSWRARGIG